MIINLLSATKDNRCLSSCSSSFQPRQIQFPARDSRVEELKARVGPRLGSHLHLKTTSISLKPDVFHPSAGFSGNVLISP